MIKTRNLVSGFSIDKCIFLLESHVLCQQKFCKSDKEEKKIMLNKLYDEVLGAAQYNAPMSKLLKVALRLL